MPRDEAPAIFRLVTPEGKGLQVLAISHTELMVAQWDQDLQVIEHTLDTMQAAELLGALTGWMQGYMERAAQTMHEATINRTLN